MSAFVALEPLETIGTIVCVATITCVDGAKTTAVSVRTTPITHGVGSTDHTEKSHSGDKPVLAKERQC